MKLKSVIQLVVLVVLVSMLFSLFNAPKGEQPVQMDYSELVRVLDEQPATITKITIVNGSNKLQVERANQKPAEVTIPDKSGQEAVTNLARQHKVTVVAKETDMGMLGIILQILTSPIVFLLFFIFLLSRMMGGQGGQIDRFRGQATRQYQPTAERKTFNDVAGCEEAKTELVEVVDFLKDPKSFREMGASLPRGVLLVGGPGNGKTLLAKAVAGEANVPFFSLAGSDFVEMFVGVGAGRARDLFTKARAQQPSIIFIDEIDAVGRHRGAGIGGGHDEREQTLNEILVQMDGFTENEAIVVIAATNRPDILDPAVVRAGRFDRHVMVDSPDLKGRVDIFKIHTRGKPVAQGLDLKILAGLTPGFSGADIANCCNEAAVVARRRRQKLIKEMKGRNAPQPEIDAIPKVITMEDFSEGIDRAMMGPARTGRIISEQEQRNTAVHEVGHAAVGLELKGDPIRKVTIMPRARALGFTLTLPEQEKYSKTKEELLNEIAMIMGGRVAQEVLLNTVDTGASNDFEQATRIARAMVTKYGMSPLGHISVSDESTSPFVGRAMGGSHGYSWGPAILDQIDAEVKAFLAEGYKRAKDVIETNRAGFELVVERLLQKETILGAEFEELWRQGTQPAQPTVEPSPESPDSAS